jgi:CheY-like chemotaxis protein
MGTIIIADDEHLVAVMLQDLLEDAGYATAIAPHGQAALALMERECPDLLITDQRMPVMTGTELAAVVRSRPEFAAIPIVLVSGAHAVTGTGSALFDAVIEKPFDKEVLLAHVERLLERLRGREIAAQAGR